MSASECLMSPGLGASYRGETRLPRTLPIISARAFSLMLLPLAMLKTPVLPRLAGMFALTTSAMYTKSRVCSPSPKIVGWPPCSSIDMKRDMTPEYSDDGSCLGAEDIEVAQGYGLQGSV